MKLSLYGLLNDAAQCAWIDEAVASGWSEGRSISFAWQTHSAGTTAAAYLGAKHEGGWLESGTDDTLHARLTA
ncbi:MAG: hypothetical protein ACT4PS_12225 [Betaproteobacteria bacterium]